ncbi:MAG: type I secretion system permease/ATPase [Gammaproteobacteria bacterium]|nr:MAG: type I secretion system permease/ATPase [Gammaproteobacteria bacterium]
MDSEPKTDLQKTLEACKSSFVSAGVFSLFVNFLMLAPAFYMLQIYDRVVASGSVSTLIVLTMIFLMLMATMGSLEWVRSRILVRQGTKIDTLLSGRLFNAGFKQALFSGGGAASSQPLNDLAGLRQFLSSNGLFAFFDSPWIPIYLLVMYFFHPLFGLVGLVSVIVLSLMAIANERATRGLFNRSNREQMVAGNYVTTNLRNAEVIESMGMLGAIRDRWAVKNNNVLYLQGLANDKQGMFAAISKSLRITIQSLTLGLGAYLAINEEISPGLMIAGSILLGRALAPIDQMIGAWKGFVTARTQYARLDEVLQKTPEDAERMALPALSGDIVADRAMITPPGSKIVAVQNASFHIVPGDVVGIIGPSAAGKSSLVRAMLGIWPTAGGAIRLDGAEAFTIDREEMGPSLGYLPQDIELFDGTVSENIARFGDVDAEKVVAAAKQAGVHEMILHLSNGYDTVIGIGGSVLSGGQRQRLGLARALYGEPSLVVLDEPNSNLDEAGESALAQALVVLKQRNCTTLVITHRINILSRVDKLMLMKDGVVVGFGPRDEIMAQMQASQTSKQVAVANPGVTPVFSEGL